MYAKIAKHPTALSQYEAKLISQGVLTKQEAQALRDGILAKLEASYQAAS